MCVCVCVCVCVIQGIITPMDVSPAALESQLAEYLASGTDRPFDLVSLFTVLHTHMHSTLTRSAVTFSCVLVGGSHAHVSDTGALHVRTCYVHVCTETQTHTHTCTHTHTHSSLQVHSSIVTGWAGTLTGHAAGL